MESRTAPAATEGTLTGTELMRIGLHGYRFLVGPQIGRGACTNVYSVNFDCMPHALKVGATDMLRSEVRAHMLLGLVSADSERRDAFLSKNKLKHLPLPVISRCVELAMSGGAGESLTGILLPRFMSDLHHVLPGLTGRDMMRAAVQIVWAFEYMHEGLFTHGDLKLDNIAINERGDAVLIDLGLATSFKWPRAAFDPQTVRICGNVFSSRDMHEGSVCTKRSDLEMLCYNLVHWVCGCLPWDTPDPGITAAERNYTMSDYKQAYFQGCPYTERGYQEDVALLASWQLLVDARGEAKRRGIRVSEEHTDLAMDPRLVEFISVVFQLSYDSEPPYAYLRDLLDKMVHYK